MAAMTKYRNHKHPMAVLESPQYAAHVMAMTAEALHDKSEIAEELAARDIEIDKLKAAIARLLVFHQEGDLVRGHAGNPNAGRKERQVGTNADSEASVLSEILGGYK
jgi:hypothetical protein